MEADLYYAAVQIAHNFGATAVTGGPIMVLAWAQRVEVPLSKRGFAVQIAHNVDDALCLAEACPPDYAVVDLKMPGPSGLDLVAKLCAQDSDLKVVVLTGYASIVTAVEAIKLGATYYLTKPTDARPW